MKKFAKFLAGKGSYIIGFGVASLIGGLISTVALAAIPDSGGTIHGCYKNSTGMLKVIDSSTNSCASSETALNWNQSGNGTTVLHDASGQVLGDALTDNLVFNHVINRIISLQGTSSADIGQYDNPGFQSSDCTGQPIAYDMSTTYKTRLFWYATNSSIVHAVISDNASPTSFSFGSYFNPDGNGGYTCLQSDGSTTTGYPLTTVSLPFSTPLAAPFKF